MSSSIVDKARKLIFPFLLFLSGIGIVWASSTIKLTVAVEEGNIVNARFYPRVVGLIVIILSLIEFFAAIKDEIVVDQVAETSEEEPIVDVNSSANNKRLIIFILAMFVYQLLFFVIGFVISTFVFLLFTFTFLGCKNRLVLFINAFAVTGLIYVVFDVLLNVPLPGGII